MGNNYGGSIVVDGLVLALDSSTDRSYPGSGTTWFDLSGQENDCSSWLNMDATNYTGSYPTHFWFSGSTSSPVSMTVGQVLDTDKSSSFTMEAWANRSGTGAWQTLIGTQNVFAQIAVSATNQYAGGENGGGGAQPFQYISEGSATDKWFHIVMTFDGTSSLVYIDGNLESSASRTWVKGATMGNTYIGSYNGSGAEDWYGKISVVRIYNRALSADEVAQNHNALKGRFF